MSTQIHKKILISGGGTGGHVFPAIAIANAIKAKAPDTEFLFVGAKGKIEMQKVPKAGYPIKGLWISGFHRKLTLKNLMFPIKLVSSLMKSMIIVRRFKPDVVVGVGGFASGPVLMEATYRKIPTLVQEQNSYAGVTNKLLAKRVDTICVAYDQMDRFFPAEKLVQTGNPVRQDLVAEHFDRDEAAAHFGLDASKKIVFVFGGSLGARTINQAMKASHEYFAQHPEIMVLWQAGSLYIDEYSQTETAQLDNVVCKAFIDRMDLAYGLAEMTISRAGALTISELCLTGKAAILIPSPNVAEDHQTKNAMALVEKDAAILLKDGDAVEQLSSVLDTLINDKEKIEQLEIAIKKLAKPNAAADIADQVLALANAER